jgi:thymidylate synthase (FAD)
MTSMPAHVEQNSTGAAQVVAVVKPAIYLIADTYAHTAAMIEATQGVFQPEGDTGETVAVFAGRACYQSFHAPNPKTSHNQGYLEHILEVGHESVLEHANYTFYFTGVSRSFTHELVRHRHFSYSQLSQRYVPEGDSSFVEPEIVANNPVLHERFLQACAAAQRAYNDLLVGLEEVVKAQGLRGTAAKKAARQAARCVLPNASETRIVVTGNARAWRHFIALRATEHADEEIRQEAVEVFRLMKDISPSLFQDMWVSQTEDGRQVVCRA